MQPEKNEQASDCDALAARLSQLSPGGAGSIQAKVFYEAGYRAGLKQRDTASVSRQLCLAAACLLVAVATGVLTARLPFEKESQHIVRAGPVEGLSSPAAATPEGVASAEQPPATIGNAPVDRQVDTSKDSGDSQPASYVAQVLGAYVTKWSQQGTVRGGVRIGPIGSGWDELVVAQIPLPIQSTAVARVDAPQWPEQLPYRPFDLNPFKQVFAN